MLPTECIECILYMCTPLQRFMVATDFRLMFLQKRVIPPVTTFHNLCARGRVDILEYAWTVFNVTKYVHPADLDRCVYLASRNGHATVLEWLKNSGIPAIANGLRPLAPRVDGEAIHPSWSHPSSMNWASEYGHVCVLDWWKESGLELHWTYRAIDAARFRGHTAVIDWWKKSGLALNYANARLCEKECGRLLTWREYLYWESCPQCKSPYAYGSPGLCKYSLFWIPGEGGLRPP